MKSDKVYIIEENGKLHFHPDRGHNRFTEGRKKISDDDRWENLDPGLAGEFEKLADAGTTSRPSPFNQSTDMGGTRMTGGGSQMSNLDSLFFNGINNVDKKQVHTGFRDVKLVKSGPSPYPRPPVGSEEMSTMWNYPPKTEVNPNQDNPYDAPEAEEEDWGAPDFGHGDLETHTMGEAYIPHDPDGFRIEGIADVNLAADLDDVITVEQFAEAGGIINLFKQASPNPLYTFGISDQQQLPARLHETYNAEAVGMPIPLGHSKFKTFSSLAEFIGQTGK